MRRKRKYTPPRLPLMAIALLLLLLLLLLLQETTNVVVRSTTDHTNLAILSTLLPMPRAIAA